MIYSERLKRIRKDKHMSQEDIAKILGISRPRYSEYENERDLMPIKYLDKISNYFDVPLDHLFGFTDNMNKKIAPYNKDIAGIRLKELRKEHKLTQSDLAKVLNSSYSTIAGYEQKRYMIATPFLYTISKKYNISADYLLGKSSNKEI